MPNALAYLMLIGWPIVSLVLFLRQPLERAILWCLIGGYLLLPPLAEFDLPLVPDMDKFSIPSVMAFFLCIALLRKPVPLLPKPLLARGLMLVFIAGVVPTVMTNGDPMVFRVLQNSDPIIFLTDMLPGLKWRDLGSVIINQIILLMPFLLARRYLSHEQGQKELLLALCLAGLAYSLPALFEIRFSPQLNTWIYGFFQHDFIQMIRGSTFRPIVFLPHALWLAFFFVTATIATASLTRVQPQGQRGKYIFAMIWLLLVIVASKSMASTGYVVALVPVVLMFSEAGRIRIALIFVALALIYPILRNAGLIPLDDIVGFFNQFSADRAQSLGFRFENEEILLQHANERRLFGWGGWGRYLTYSPWDGTQDAVADGRWIFIFGTYGIFGFFAEFGLLASPILLIWLRHKRLPEGESLTHSGTLALMLGITMFDLLLNAAIVPYIWLIAGALIAAAEKPARVTQRSRQRTEAVIDIQPVKEPERRTVI